MAGRIRIEPYKPLDVHTPPVPGGGYIQVDASTASPGTFGPSALAKQVLEVAQGLPSVAHAVSAQLARDDEAVVKDADLRLGQAEQTLLFDPQGGYINTQGQQALTHAPAVLEVYGQAQQREIEALANDEQRRMLENLAQRRLTTFAEQVERHSTGQRLRWHDTASEQRIAQMRTDAGFYWSDDALLRRALGTTRAEVRDKAERNGWASPLTEAALRQQTSPTLVSAIEAAVERDPERARSLRTRYDQHIEATDRIALDALLAEAQTRQRAQQAGAAILNTTPPDGQAPTLKWQLQQAEAIAEPAVRAATLRTLHSAAAAVEARARALAEQVLARVLKDGLTDPSQIPVREWVSLDRERHQAIETRLDHNAAGTEPASNPALVDELATQMTEAPGTFARRDLVPSVAHLPLPQWQRFRDLQAGIRRNDPATEDELHTIKRGLQLATKMLPANAPDDSATNYRAELVEEIDTWRRLTGRSPDDAEIADMLKRRVRTEPYVTDTLEGNPRARPEILQVRDDTTTYWPSLNALKRALELVIGAEASRQMSDAMRAMSRGVEGNTKAFAEVVGLKPADGYPSRIITNGEDVYYNPQTGHYLIRNNRGRRGFWIEFDKRGELVGVVDMTLNYPTRRDQLSPEQVKEWTRPVPFPVDDPLPPLPGLIPTPLPKWQEGFTVVPPPPPLPGFSYPEIDVPLYVEAEWEWHHYFPQRFWNPDRENPYPFSRDARRFFDNQIVRVPRGDHWGKLHSTYNKVVGQLLEAYLIWVAAEAGKSVKNLVGNMTEAEARGCYEKILQTIRDSADDAPQDMKDAKEFLKKMKSFEPK